MKRQPDGAELLAMYAEDIRGRFHRRASQPFMPDKLAP